MNFLELTQFELELFKQTLKVEVEFFVAMNNPTLLDSRLELSKSLKGYTDTIIRLNLETKYAIFKNNKILIK